MSYRQQPAGNWLRSIHPALLHILWAFQFVFGRFENDHQVGLHYETDARGRVIFKGEYPVVEQGVTGYAEFYKFEPNEYYKGSVLNDLYSGIGLLVTEESIYDGEFDAYHFIELNSGDYTFELIDSWGDGLSWPEDGWSLVFNNCHDFGTLNFLSRLSFKQAVSI